MEKSEAKKLLLEEQENHDISDQDIEEALNQIGNIPICPNPECNKPLETIYPETSGERYVWNEQDGEYDFDDAQIQMRFLCGECNKAVGGCRADGENWGVIPEVR